MCPKLTELLSWNGPTVHVCCFMLARASTKTFVSRFKKTSKNFFVIRKIRFQGHSLSEVSLCRVLVGKPEGKRPLGRPRRRWKDNIKMDLKEV